MCPSLPKSRHRSRSRRRSLKLATGVAARPNRAAEWRWWDSHTFANRVLGQMYLVLLRVSGLEAQLYRPRPCRRPFALTLRTPQ
jgi:hypothetical protein